MVREYAPIGLPAAPRIESEVCALELARRSGVPVPAVYDWGALSTVDGEPTLDENGAEYGSREGGIGWMVLEFIEGEDMIDVYRKAETQERKLFLLKEFARMAEMIRNVKLPPGMGFGGFAFGKGRGTEGMEEEEIVSGEMPNGIGGPFNTIQDVIRRTIEKQMELADGNNYINGWRRSAEEDATGEKNTRHGIDGFLKSKRCKEMLREIEQANQPTFVHGDFGE